MKTYGEILKKHREAAGLSQSELAEACKIPVASVRNHEQGRREIALADMFIYCEVLKLECTVFKQGVPAVVDKRKSRGKLDRKPKARKWPS